MRGCEWLRSLDDFVSARPFAPQFRPSPRNKAHFFCCFGGRPRWRWFSRRRRAFACGKVPQPAPPAESGSPLPHGEVIAQSPPPVPLRCWSSSFRSGDAAAERGGASPRVSEKRLGAILAPVAEALPAACPVEPHHPSARRERLEARHGGEGGARAVGSGSPDPVPTRPARAIPADGGEPRLRDGALATIGLPEELRTVARRWGLLGLSAGPRVIPGGGARWDAARTRCGSGEGRRVSL